MTASRRPYVTVSGQNEVSMKIYLLRHGESVDDVEDAYGGIADFPLSDAGREAAQALATRLADSGITLLYASPYKRAHETATIFQARLDCELCILDGLRERNSFGVLSGVNRARAKELFAYALRGIEGLPGYYYSNELVPGAEPVPDFVERVKETFLSAVANAKGHEVIGIVTHGNVIRAAYQHIFKIDGKVGLDLLAVTVLTWKPTVIEIQRTEGVRVD
jgi:broad specificity phosphatase PhoE